MIWYASDLHLVGAKPFPWGPGDADGLLILAGDICELAFPEVWLPFMMRMGSLYSRVVWLAGNHEWWRGSDHLAEATQFLLDSAAPNVDFVPVRERIEWKGTTILTATLWTKLSACGRDYALSDPRGDVLMRKGWTVEDWENEHRASVEWLNSELALGDALVVSHHAPLIRHVSDPKYPIDARAEIFGSDVLPLLESPPSVWIYGHTHWRTEFQWNDTRVLSNPLGHDKERYGWSGPACVSTDRSLLL